jgi:hypothetical protein
MILTTKEKVDSDLWVAIESIWISPDVAEVVVEGNCVIDVVDGKIDKIFSSIVSWVLFYVLRISLH